MADAQDLIANDACAIVDLLWDGEIKPHDLLDALERRIAAVDPAVNACPHCASSGPAPMRIG